MSDRLGRSAIEGVCIEWVGIGIIRMRSHMAHIGVKNLRYIVRRHDRRLVWVKGQVAFRLYRLTQSSVVSWCLRITSFSEEE